VSLKRAPLNRRQLGRELTAAGRADVAAMLRADVTSGESAAFRIGITGPPGAGKSTVVSRLAERFDAQARRVGVLAVDPTSPVSGGSILGDRIRMDEVSPGSDVYIRSVPSRSAQDGLTCNVAEMLNIMDRHEFDDVFIETVGVGQTDHAVQALVDTVVLVLVPESGDTIQAMKAGILELADVYVVNKADRPHASRMHAAIEGVLALSQRSGSGWQPPVLMTSASSNDLAGLEQAIADHRQWCGENIDPVLVRRRRSRQLIESIMASAVAEVTGDLDDRQLDLPVDALYTACLDALRTKGQ